MGVFDVYSWMYRLPVHLLLIRVKINNSYLYRKRIENGIIRHTMVFLVAQG